MKELLNRVAAYLSDYTHDTDGMVEELRAAAEQCEKPVEYQFRMRPTWDDRHPWSSWEKCSKGSYEDYVRVPINGDWAYEVRALYLAPPAQPSPHLDDVAVDAFASAMKAKMSKKRADGRKGWDDKTQCSAAFLQAMLIDHLGKGDPVDIGNIAMMLWNRGDPTVSPAQPEELARLRYLYNATMDNLVKPVMTFEEWLVQIDKAMLAKGGE